MALPAWKLCQPKKRRRRKTRNKCTVYCSCLGGGGCRKMTGDFPRRPAGRGEMPPRWLGMYMEAKVARKIDRSASGLLKCSSANQQRCYKKLPCNYPGPVKLALTCKPLCAGNPKMDTGTIQHQGGREGDVSCPPLTPGNHTGTTAYCNCCPLSTSLVQLTIES